MTPMKPRFKVVRAVACALALQASAHAEDRFATRPDAEALVIRVVAALQTDRKNTLHEITARNSNWVLTDLYPVVYDASGKCIAHGHNPRQVGKRLIDLTDADGKPFIRQRIEMAKSNRSFWQEYKFPDPVTRKVLPKASYCEVVDKLIVCAGVYQR